MDLNPTLANPLASYSVAESTKRRNISWCAVRDPLICGDRIVRMARRNSWSFRHAVANGRGRVDRERGESETAGGRQRDFPNAFQPTELNVIMHGEDFIIGR